jgi:hypothetical protein
VRTWIFQGNPKLFDVDSYLSQFRLIIWMVRQKHFASQMNIGDSVYLWRSDAGDVGSGGIVAHGTMIDLPKMLDDEEAAKYYSKSIDATPTLRVKILLDSVLSGLSILQIANSTNFEVDPSQVERLDKLYFEGEQEPATSDDNEASEFPEGSAAFVTHRKRERNPALIRAAKANALKTFGRLFCLACGFDFGKVYGRFGEGFANTAKRQITRG